MVFRLLMDIQHILFTSILFALLYPRWSQGGEVNEFLVWDYKRKENKCMHYNI